MIRFSHGVFRAWLSVCDAAALPLPLPLVRGETADASGHELLQGPNVLTKTPNDNRVLIAFSTERNSGIGSDLADPSPEMSKTDTWYRAMIAAPAAASAQADWELIVAPQSSMRSGWIARHDRQEISRENCMTLQIPDSVRQDVRLS